jgi:hypothetical protein
VKIWIKYVNLEYQLATAHHTLLNSNGAPRAPISTATVCEFVTSKRSSIPLLSETQRRVIFKRDVVGRVGLRLAAARVEPETAAAVNFFRAVDESPLTQAVEPTLRAMVENQLCGSQRRIEYEPRNVISPAQADIMTLTDEKLARAH